MPTADRIRELAQQIVDCVGQRNLRDGAEAAIRTALAEQRAEDARNCRGVSAAWCNYLAHCGTICMKCGKEHPGYAGHAAAIRGNASAESEDARDAARYRWLRGDVPAHSERWPRWEVRYWNGQYWGDMRLEELDAAIDAAGEKK